MAMASATTTVLGLLPSSKQHPRRKYPCIDDFTKVIRTGSLCGIVEHLRPCNEVCCRWRSGLYPRRKGLERQLSRRRCVSRATSEETIMEGDVVEYPLPEHVRQGGLYGNRLYGVGAVSELTSHDSSILCHLEPLIMDEPPQPTWIVDERQGTVVVPLSEVRRLQAWLSMRMVDDRISNPHGEHAEHLWLVEEALSPHSGSPMYNEPGSR